LGDMAEVNQLRGRLRGVPIVSTCAMSPTVANTVVAGSNADAMRVVREHFQAQGVRTIALFSTGNANASALNTAALRLEVPDAPVLVHELREKELIKEPSVAVRKLVGHWLWSLPKPAGILTPENFTGRLLSRVCQKVGLRVPRDIQIIGIDDADACLDCEPHLTSLQLPGERIGEVAMETMMRYVRHEQPPPPPIIRVEGITVIPRGSTGPVATDLGSVSRALNLIESHATKGLTAETVAKRSRVGRTAFFKQFRATTGTTPAQLLRHRRLTEACRMLKETPASITAIAESCGFSSANYFAEVFHRTTGQTPRAYRQKQADQEKV
jgi:LacI family transcriptional regulator